jgi:hypothetical protein
MSGQARAPSGIRDLSVAGVGAYSNIVPATDAAGVGGVSDPG